MDRFVGRCDELEETILEMMGNLGAMLGDASKTFKITVDSEEWIDEDQKSREELQTKIKERTH